jgi:ubiquinone/menaquinone biosynthesis C-methylase UbiE
VSDLRASWEAEAERWAAWARTPGHDHFFWRLNWPAFTELLPAPGRRTLDLGCGEGRCGRWLAEHGHRVTGVDASPTLAGLARDAGGYEEIVESDAAALPFADASFDLVSAFMSLHDVDDLEGVLAEVVRVLEPGGRLCAAIVHPYSSAHLGGELQAPYFETRRVIDTFAFDGLEMTFHSMHRSLEAYAGALRRAGLLIEDLREPSPSADHVRDRPEMAKSLARPTFLHLRALHAA